MNLFLLVTCEINLSYMQLLTAPRCGVPDVPKNGFGGNGNRTKRFAIGSRGWTKHRITY